MHVLTKVFIVLVSLMTVMLVPLVVVYANNEDSFKAKFQAAEAQSAASRESADAANLRYANLQAAMADLQARSTDELKLVAGERDRQAAEVRRLEHDLAQSKTMQSEIRAQLATLASAVDAGQKLADSLIDELRKLRTNTLVSQQKVVELEDVVRDVRAQLDVANAARKASQEELQRVKEEGAKLTDELARMVEKYGRLADNVLISQVSGLAPDRTMETPVLNVRRGDGATLVEIAAGSRDGIKLDWVMSLRRGSQFLGRLQITEVDINRSVGKVSLEDSKTPVREGDTASAYAGRK